MKLALAQVVQHAERHGGMMQNQTLFVALVCCLSLTSWPAPASEHPRQDNGVKTGTQKPRLPIVFREPSRRYSQHPSLRYMVAHVMGPMRETLIGVQSGELVPQRPNPDRGGKWVNDRVLEYFDDPRPFRSYVHVPRWVTPPPILYDHRVAPAKEILDKAGRDEPYRKALRTCLASPAAFTRLFEDPANRPDMFGQMRGTKPSIRQQLYLDLSALMRKSVNVFHPEGSISRAARELNLLDAMKRGKP